MKIKIWQICMERDTSGLAFMSMTMRKERDCAEVDLSIYNKVFEGDVDANGLEDVFSTFNADYRTMHQDYKGRSLSVSDVVEVVDAPVGSVEPGYWFCDSIGFKRVKPVNTPKDEDAVCIVSFEFSPIEGEEKPATILARMKMPEDEEQFAQAKMDLERAIADKMDAAAAFSFKGLVEIVCTGIDPNAQVITPRATLHF